MSVHNDLMNFNFRVITNTYELIETHLLEAIQSQQASLALMLNVNATRCFNDHIDLDQPQFYMLNVLEDKETYDSVIKEVRLRFVTFMRDVLRRSENLGHNLKNALNLMISKMELSSYDLMDTNELLPESLRHHTLVLAYQSNGETIATSIYHAIDTLVELDVNAYQLICDLVHTTIPVYTDPMYHQLISRLEIDYDTKFVYHRVLGIRSLFNLNEFQHIEFNQETKDLLVEYLASRSEFSPQLINFIMSDLCATCLFYQSMFRSVLDFCERSISYSKTLQSAMNHIQPRSGKVTSARAEDQFFTKENTLNQSRLIKQLASLYQYEEDVIVSLSPKMVSMLQHLENSSKSVDRYFEHLTNQSFTRQMYNDRDLPRTCDVVIKNYFVDQMTFDTDLIYAKVVIDQHLDANAVMGSAIPLESLKDPITIHSWMTTEEHALEIISELPQTIKTKHVYYSLTNHIDRFVQLLVVETNDSSNFQAIVAPAVDRNSKLQPIVIHKDMQFKVACEGRVYSVSPLQLQSFTNKTSSDSFTLACREELFYYLGFSMSVRLQRRQMISYQKAQEALLNVDEIRNELSAIQ